MNSKTTWKHASAENRKDVGLPIEERFPKEIKCHCGGTFRHPKYNYYHKKPDFVCDACGQTADVKYSEQTIRTGNIAVSSARWNDYPDDMLVVTYTTGTWQYNFKYEITPINADAHESTHAKHGGYNGNYYSSSFYLISVEKSLIPIE